MGRYTKLLIIALVVIVGMMAAGCSSSPSEEELRKLTESQALVRQLEEQIAMKKRDNATLEKQNAEKNGKLQQCQADQDGAKKAMGGGK